MIELRQLRQFVVVAEELHFHRAARRLNMSQPPLSAAIRRLEADIGEALIVRGNRHNTLTAAGAALLVEARSTLAQAAQCAPAARDAAHGVRGRVRLGYVGSAMYGRLPETVRTFRRAYPAVGLDLEERTTARQIAALRQGETDLALVLPPIADSTDLSFADFDTDCLAIAIAREHPLADKPMLAVEDLAEASFVFWPAHEGRGFYQRAVDLCLRAGFEPRIVQHAEQMHGVIALVAADVGVAIVPASMAGVHRPDVVYRPITTADAVFELCWCWRAERETPALANLVAFAGPPPG
ncbi:LysR family transcriptional regulator [Salinisphaera sp. Q1T1-3]|uniref:LysR family transcriptional regulator n=1 Tax=Salinisphaera sp. Q1T1-3 TaxID=2321229 RepID=UPI000E750595|nr:LysR family transcriptional regulator [Salinisphaera sp. Q1T1-3]RJS91509.1 LysR family transcriptional regulator [Salinisphaera sp. Q1T1-3]